MIDPINPNQNQQNSNNVINPIMPQNQPQVQEQNAQNHHSTVSSKPELGPVIDNYASSENQDFENQPIAESSGEFSSPSVGGEVSDMIQVKKDFPDLDHNAKNAGVTETIPTGPVYGNFPATLQAAEETYKEKPPSSSEKWRALQIIKNFSKNLLGQTKPIEA